MSLTPPSWQGFSIRQVIPHQGQMVLLDAIQAYEPEHSVTCSVHVGAWSLFHNEEGLVPAYVGMEYMAQTVSAFFGIGRRLVGEPLEMGFLLGTRRMHLEVDAFQPGQQLTITASRVYDYNGMGVFHCTITDAKKHQQTPLMEGQINVYRPSHPNASFDDPVSSL